MRGKSHTPSWKRIEIDTRISLSFLLLSLKNQIGLKFQLFVLRLKGVERGKGRGRGIIGKLAEAIVVWLLFLHSILDCSLDVRPGAL